jgi:hypothetical protein
MVDKASRVTITWLAFLSDWILVTHPIIYSVGSGLE